MKGGQQLRLDSYRTHLCILMHQMHDVELMNVQHQDYLFAPSVSLALVRQELKHPQLEAGWPGRGGRAQRRLSAVRSFASSPLPRVVPPAFQSVRSSIHSPQVNRAVMCSTIMYTQRYASLHFVAGVAHICRHKLNMVFNFQRPTSLPIVARAQRYDVPPIVSRFLNMST